MIYICTILQEKTLPSFGKKQRIKTKAYCENLAKLSFPLLSFYRVVLDMQGALKVNN